MYKDTVSVKCKETLFHSENPNSHFGEIGEKKSTPTKEMYHNLSMVQRFRFPIHSICLVIHTVMECNATLTTVA